MGEQDLGIEAGRITDGGELFSGGFQGFGDGEGHKWVVGVVLVVVIIVYGDGFGFFKIGSLSLWERARVRGEACHCDARFLGRGNLWGVGFELFIWNRYRDAGSKSGLVLTDEELLYLAKVPKTAAP